MGFAWCFGSMHVAKGGQFLSTERHHRSSVTSLTLASSLEQGIARSRTAASACRCCRLGRRPTLLCLANGIRDNAARDAHRAGHVAAVQLASIGFDDVSGLHAIIHSVRNGEASLGQAEGERCVLFDGIVADGDRCTACCGCDQDDGCDTCKERVFHERASSVRGGNLFCLWNHFTCSVAGTCGCPA